MVYPCTHHVSFIKYKVLEINNLVTGLNFAFNCAIAYNVELS
jgi:hypothetical protein